MDWKTAVDKGIPLVVGMCSCAAIESLLKEHVPEKEKLIAKVARRIGIFGVGCVVSSAVNSQMESEVKSVTDILEPMVSALRRGSSEDQCVREVDLPNAVYLNTDQDGDTEANTYVSSRIEDVEKRQEELQAMANDIREKLKVSMTGQDIPKEEANGGSTEA